jgi:DNA-binding winged helix-turn-helix (wHTH) protein
LAEHKEVISFDEYRLEILPESLAHRKRLRLFRGGEKVVVGESSLHVLEQLLSYAPNTPIREADLAEDVWGKESFIDNVETHISRLRAGFGDNARNPRFIKTIRGTGYQFLLNYTREQQPISATAERERPDDIRKAFVDFFGVSTEEQNGVIILQSDQLDEQLKDSGHRHRIGHPSSRFYKARTCVNTWDTYGALAIQDAFRRQGRRTPRLVLCDHRIRETSHLSAPFKISMGLGFTDETTKTIENESCGSWLSISKTSGDAVSFTKKLLPAKSKTRLSWAADGKADFCRLLPAKWSKTYVDAWLRMLPPINGPEVRDYAMIFRHTRLKPQRQVLFVVAGFTERGTGIAGQYLADHWKELWETHVKGQGDHGSLGDFLVIIEGPSDPESIHDWSEDKAFRITPQKLLDKRIRCERADRMRAG